MLGCLAQPVCGQDELRIWAIDTEGGKATLVVGPTGQGMLIDAGFPGFQDRDLNRIVQVVSQAGLKRLDYLVVTHYDIDHVGNVPAVANKIPVDTFVDHGAPAVTDRMAKQFYEAYLKVTEGAKRIVVKPGDHIPMAGLEITVVSSGGKLIEKPVDGNGLPNPLCSTASRKTWSGVDEDQSENACSIGLLFKFGNFKMLDLADLTWNKELDLVCPVNLLGAVDVFMVSHHGHEISNSPALIHAIRPAVAIMNNGSRKFGYPACFEALRSCPSRPQVYQLHWSERAGQLNSPEELIANLRSGPDGNWLCIIARPDGTFKVKNSRTGQAHPFPGSRREGDAAK
jgi:beta-lactamase superfamily II metal-dependent hydrolase